MTDDRALDPYGRVPLYLQVAQLLRQAIMSGAIPPGELLESQNVMADTYGVSVETARRAVEVLRQEGLLVTRRGVGSYAASPLPPIEVRASPGDVVTARMPTRGERDRLGIAEGVPVISLQRAGEPEQLYDANRAQVITLPPPRGQEPARPDPPPP